MDTSQIEAIKGRLAKITPGPWAIDPLTKHAAPEIMSNHAHRKRRIAKALYDIGSEDPYVQHNAAFIAAAPDDVRALLAEVERLSAENEHLREEYKRLDELFTPLLHIRVDPEEFDRVRRILRKAEPTASEGNHE